MRYKPHDYQKYAINFIKEHPIAAILLDMGMGKTSIVLAALNDLIFDSFEVSKVLIIAPLRVAKHTWPTEIQKWDQLKGLRYSIVVGTAAERRRALMVDADIYIINRENIPWLIEKSGQPFDYDMVVIDELSSFKNWQAKRFRALMKVRPMVKRIVGLTGTPSSNGLMDLFAEYKLPGHGRTPGKVYQPVPAGLFCAGSDERTRCVQLPFKAGGRQENLQPDFGYYDFHEGNGPSEDAGVGKFRIYGLHG